MVNNLKEYYKEWMKKGYSAKQVRNYLRKRNIKNGDKTYKEVKGKGNVKVIIAVLVLIIVVSLVVFFSYDRSVSSESLPGGIEQGRMQEEENVPVLEVRKTPLEVINEAYREKDSSKCSEIDDSDFGLLCVGMVEKDVNKCNEIVNENLESLCLKKLESM